MWSLTLTDSRADAGMYSYSFSHPALCKEVLYAEPVQEMSRELNLLSNLIY